jgi:hypothetical protein
MVKGKDEEVAAEAADIASETSEEPRSADIATRVGRAARYRGRLARLAHASNSAARRASSRTGTATRYAGKRAAGVTGTGISKLSDQVLVMAPRLKVRNNAQLREQFPGMSAEDIADALIDGAARASAAAGGAAGLAAALPVLPAFPAEVAAETLVVVGIEIKLIAELHEAYGVPAPGGPAQRMTAYIGAWANRRGVSVIPGGVAFAAGSPLTQLLRRRLTARAGRSAISLGPLLTGAAAGAYLNSRETRRLGRQVRRDLRQRRGQHDG